VMSAIDTALPQSVDAERAVLGSILINNTSIERISGTIEASDFYREAHRTVFAAMKTLAEQGHEIDLLTLKDDLAKRGQLDVVGGSAYISSLVDGIPDVANVERYARIVKEKSTRRRLVVVGNSVVRDALDQEDDAGDIVARAETALELCRPLATAGGDAGFMFVSQLPEPGPQEFIVDALIPSNFITIMFALGGSRKSFLALFIAFCVCLGRPIFGMRVKQSPVLYLDGELDLAVFQRRCARIANGMGIEQVPSNLVYRRVGSVIDPRESRLISKFIDENGVGLTVIDSWSACVPCDDVNSLDDVIGKMRQIEHRFGTTLLIDHTRKSSDGEATPFGSVAKMNQARSVLQLTGTSEGAVLKQTKSNFDAPAQPVAFALNFSPDMVCLDQIGLDDARVEEAAHAIPTIARIQAAFESGRFESGASAHDIAEALEMRLKTVQNKLTILTDKRVLRKDGALWFPLNAAHSPHSPSPKGTWGMQGGESPGESPREFRGESKGARTQREKSPGDSPGKFQGMANREKSGRSRGGKVV
jgi:DnaB helicase-like protein/AAA domain-containing protein